jgi:hypothetical protein
LAKLTAGATSDLHAPAHEYFGVAPQESMEVLGLSGRQLGHCAVEMIDGLLIDDVFLDAGYTCQLREVPGAEEHPVPGFGPDEIDHGPPDAAPCIGREPDTTPRIEPTLALDERQEPVPNDIVQMKTGWVHRGHLIRQAADVADGIDHVRKGRDSVHDRFSSG